MILQIVASFADWFLFNCDITGAFLQGDQSLASRCEALYLRQPREGLPGLLRGQLVLVARGIFGLANSPRLFWRHLRDTLLRMGFIQGTLDRALFMFYKANRLVLVLGTHVDDLIGAGAPGELALMAFCDSSARPLTLGRGLRTSEAPKSTKRYSVPEMKRSPIFANHVGGKAQMVLNYVYVSYGSSCWIQHLEHQNPQKTPKGTVFQR